MKTPLFAVLILTVILALTPPVLACEEDHAPHAHGATGGMDHDMTMSPATVDVTVHPVRLPLITDETITVDFTLTQDKKALLLSDLATVHTQKIHVMAIDPTLTDYHHLHAVAGKTPGAFTISFTPQKEGPYRFFVDITTAADHAARLGQFDLGGDFTAAHADLHDTSKSYIDGYRFTLLTGDAPLRVGAMAHLTLQVTDKDDKPVVTLEPIMGAFAHLVGFAPDASTMMHMHPQGAEPKDATARGGPQMMFMMTPQKPGKTPLFAQVQINGKVITAPFVMDVGE